MFRSGYLQIASFRGSPIRVHWTLPILCILWTGARFAPGAWLGALFVLLVHELGHAYLARRYRMQVIEVMLHGLGGHCAYVGEPTPWQRSIVSSGGVLAQAMVLALALPMQWFLEASTRPVPDFVWDLIYALTISNFGIAMFNLVPIPPLDGAEIWKLPGLWLARRRRRSMTRPSAPAAAPAARVRVETPRPTQAPRTPAPTEVDEKAVRETVRRALEEARKSSGQRPN